MSCTFKKRTQPMSSAFKSGGRDRNVATTASGLSSAYSQIPEMIPSPRSEESSSNRFEETFVLGPNVVVRRVSDTETSIVCVRSFGVSGLSRCDNELRRD